jgi:sodium-dependent phosphate cotransporter
MDSDPPSSSGRSGWHRLLIGLLSLFCFVAGLQLLRSATATLTPELGTLFDHYVRGGLPTLGFSWLTSYVLTNGSVAAAIAVTYFESGLLDASNLLLMVGGTRLGGAGIVILIGIFDYLFHRETSLRRACSMGVLVFVVTHLASIPATGLGYAWVWLRPTWLSGSLGIDALQIPLPASFDFIADSVTGALGAMPTFAFGLVGLMGSLKLFDAILETGDSTALRARITHALSSRWVAFLLGVIVTSLTLSVAFSLGLLVPLYNRERISDELLIPYILGANIGTLADTFVVALIIERAGAVSVMLSFVGALFVTTLLLLALFRPVNRLTLNIQDWTTRNDRNFILFAVSVILVPILMLAVGFV